MRILRDSSFTATVSAHLGVDLLNSQHPLLLAFFSVPLGLTNTWIGVLGTLYTLSNSLSQPIFGLLADRLGARWIAAGGVLWMAGMFAIAVSVQGYASLAFLILAALGSAAYHPAGAMEATDRGNQFLAGRETTAASLFFLFGQGGLSFGPAIGGVILDRWGPAGLLLLLTYVLPSGVIAGRWMSPRSFEREGSEGGGAARLSIATGGLLVFILLVATRSWTMSNLVVFIPKYYSDLGLSASSYGLLAALLMGGSAVGGVTGGLLADRFGQRRVLATAMLLAAVPIGLYPELGDSGWRYLITPLSGAFTGASHSIVLVMAQRLLPRRRGMASGLILGFTFASGSVGTLVSGFQADRFGFGAFFYTTAGIALVAMTLTLLLGRLWPVTRPQRIPV